MKVFSTMDGDTRTNSTLTPLLNCLPDVGRGEYDELKKQPSEETHSHTVTFPDEVVAQTPMTPSNQEHCVGIDDPNRKSMYKRMLSHPCDELRYFRNGLRWLGLDQSTKPKMLFSWIVFLLFTFVVPFVNLTSISCPDCDSQHRHPFEELVQIAETAMAAVSFLCLSHIVRRYGLRRTLLLDRIARESEEVRKGYESELHVSTSSIFSTLILLWTILTPFAMKLSGTSCFTNRFLSS